MLFVHLISMKQITKPPLPKPLLHERKGMARMTSMQVRMVSHPLVSKAQSLITQDPRHLLRQPRANPAGRPSKLELARLGPIS